MMPRFFEDMPPSTPGRWVAVVLRNYGLPKRKEVWAKEFNGLRLAYVMARLMALWEDLSCPYYNGEVGVEWAVREAKITCPHCGKEVNPRCDTRKHLDAGGDGTTKPSAVHYHGTSEKSYA